LLEQQRASESKQDRVPTPFCFLNGAIMPRYQGRLVTGGKQDEAAERVDISRGLHRHILCSEDLGCRSPVCATSSCCLSRAHPCKAKVEELGVQSGCNTRRAAATATVLYDDVAGFDVRMHNARRP